MAFIESITTAVPPYSYSQREIFEAAQKIFDGKISKSYFRIFESSKVKRRYLSQRLDYYLKPKTFAEKNGDAVSKIGELSEKVLKNLCQTSGFRLKDLNQLVVVNSTALATPTIDALLIHRMKLPSQTRRTPLFGLGCVGGAVGLARASAFAKAYPKDNIVLINVELCGHTFNLKDYSLKNLIAATLFGDGASCVLVRGVASGNSKAEILSTGSVTFPDSTHVMGWYFSELGLGLVLSRDLPDLVRAKLGSAMKVFLQEARINFSDIKHFVMHPGGPKVIEAVRDALNLDPRCLELSWKHLENFGNLSSASVIFVLKDFLELKKAKRGEVGLLFALGPGFSAEFVLLKFL